MVEGIWGLLNGAKCKRFVDCKKKEVKQFGNRDERE